MYFFSATFIFWLLWLQRIFLPWPAGRVSLYMSVSTGMHCGHRLTDSLAAGVITDTCGNGLQDISHRLTMLPLEITIIMKNNLWRYEKCMCCISQFVLKWLNSAFFFYILCINPKILLIIFRIVTLNDNDNTRLCAHVILSIFYKSLTKDVVPTNIKKSFKKTNLGT